MSLPLIPRKLKLDSLLQSGRYHGQSVRSVADDYEYFLQLHKENPKMFHEECVLEFYKYYSLANLHDVPF